jgi:hypothetical protein
LLSIQERPMKVQEKILEEAFEKWKVDAPQSDDILVVGIKISDCYIALPLPAPSTQQETRLAFPE